MTLLESTVGEPPQNVTDDIDQDAGSDKKADQSKFQSGEDSKAEDGKGRAQLLHGPFSYCNCLGCMEDAKKEAEKRFDNNTFAFEYIKKLEGLVTRLQLQANSDEEIDPRDEVYHNGRMRRRSSVESLRETLDFSKFAGSANPAGPSHVPQEVAVVEVEDNGEDKGPRVEIKRMKTVIDRYGNPRTEKDRKSPKVHALVDLSNEYVLSVIREHDKMKNYWRRTVEILSPPFIELLRGIAHSNVYIPAPDGMLSMKEPLMLLFHNRGKLAEYLQTDRSDPEKATVAQTLEHTKLVMEFLQNECQDVVKAQDNLRVCGPSSVIKYEYAWLLYAPGTVVFSKENGEYEAFVVESIRGCQKHQPSYYSRHTHSSMELTCWSINYDGEIFGRVWSKHYLAPFEELKEISSLPLIPEAFLPDKDAVKASLVERGDQFWRLQGQCFKEYTGEVWSSRISEAPLRVMVDHLTYQRRMEWPIEIDLKRGPANAQSKNWRDNRFERGRPHGRRVISISPPRRRRPARGGYDHNIFALGDTVRDIEVERDNSQDRYELAYERVDCDRPPQASDAIFRKYDVLKPDSEPDERTKLLCPQIVQGPVAFRENAWERLVLDEENKNIVQAMVSSYVDKTATIDDLIAGKGAGLVTLLHGPPGTGKTLTAECVAEAFGKPLYQVTCGELGTYARDLEERLEEIFDDAVTWGAILVLDEADVFLQERDYEYLERNALVSVFLRTLEYFNGILFLTTNRVGTFDQAFQSRIHITLGLPLLDRPRRTSIWSIFLDELAKSSQLPSSHLKALRAQAEDVWSLEPLNGRQIRNSVRTALLVAEKEGKAVGKEHFERVLKIGREFEGYMSALKKVDGAEGRAERRGERLADLGGFQEV
ncbi:MAG: hypothetical protein Q9219_006401 [cf. Caloplaca sp. 3 TL-2023]